MPDSRLGELYLEAITNAGTPKAVTQPQSSRLGELYLEALTDAGVPGAIVLNQAGQLDEIYLEVLTDATALLIPWTDGAIGSDGADGYSPLILADGASYYFPLGEPSGTPLRDLVSGQSAGATEYNVTRQIPAAANLPDHALGSSGSWLFIDFGYDGRGYGSQSALTAEVWLRVTPAQLAGRRPSVLNVGGSLFQLLLNTEGTLQVALSAGSTGYSQSGSVQVADGRWHHVVVATSYRTDPSGAVNTRVFVDGRVDIAVHTDGASPNPGYWHPALGQYFGQYYGDFDQFALYFGTALTPAQVAKHYALGTALHESLLSISHVQLADTGTSADTGFGAETVTLPAETVTGTDTLRVRVQAPPGPRIPAAPAAMNSANSAALSRVRVGDQLTVDLAPLDGGNDVRLTLAAPTRFAVTLDSASLVAVAARYRSVVPPIELHSANRAAITARTLGGDHDPIPVSLSPSPDASITISDNPAMRLSFSSQARLHVLPGGIGLDPAYDPMAGLDPRVLSDQEEVW